MQVEAIYKDGQVNLLKPLKLRRNNVRLVVMVPNEEVETVAQPEVDLRQYGLRQEVIEAARKTQARYDAIRNAPLPPDDELPPLPEDFEERVTASAGSNRP